MHQAAPDTPVRHPFSTLELYRVLRLFIGPAQAYRMTFGARGNA